MEPISAKLPLQCLDKVRIILPFIITPSFREGVFSSVIKTALALAGPTIKDQNGDSNCYKNCRPISNLTLLSQFLEEYVQKQLSEHLQAYELHAENHNGYRTNRSCETATLATMTFLCISDAVSKIILLMLDLSAPFNTVCHNVF